MSKGLIYIHGNDGSAKESERFKPFFSDYVLIGFDYQSKTPWEAIDEFRQFFEKHHKKHEQIIIIGNSIGAYFSLHALANKPIQKAYFISPIVDMETLIKKMMAYENISEMELKRIETICTSKGELLSWQYLSWVREHPILWKIPTFVLYGKNDRLQSLEAIQAFADASNADLTIMEDGEHWFHTDEQLAFLDKWISSH